MKRIHVPVAIVGAVLLGALALVESPSAKRVYGTPIIPRVVDPIGDSVVVPSVHLDVQGRENALGAPCEIVVQNLSRRKVEKQLRVVYFSHMGAELLRTDRHGEEWIDLRLEGRERKVVTQHCPFYTAREARVEMR